MSDPVVLLDARHLQAAQELRAVLAEERALAERKAAAKAVLSEVLTDVGQQAVDDDGIMWASVKAGSHRFDAEEARRNLHPKLLALIVRDVPDGTLAKDMLPPSEYAKCCKATAPSIVAAK